MLKTVLQRLHDAVISSGAGEAVSSNELGEAMDDAEELLRG